MTLLEPEKDYYLYLNNRDKLSKQKIDIYHKLHNATDAELFKFKVAYPWESIVVYRWRTDGNYRNEIETQAREQKLHLN